MWIEGGIEGNNRSSFHGMLVTLSLCVIMTFLHWECIIWIGDPLRERCRRGPIRCPLGGQRSRRLRRRCGSPYGGAQGPVWSRDRRDPRRESQRNPDPAGPPMCIPFFGGVSLFSPAIPHQMAVPPPPDF